MTQNTQVKRPFEKRLLAEVLAEEPALSGWLEQLSAEYRGTQTVEHMAQAQPPGFYTRNGYRPDDFVRAMEEYVQAMSSWRRRQTERIRTVTIVPGRNKSGVREAFDALHIERGQIVAIVGPTGSGKSRLLEDIEYGANGDTPTGRRILFDGVPRDRAREGIGAGRLVALLSQTMNFVIDLTVLDFLRLHASCWLEDSDRQVEAVFEMANRLAGEPFSEDTPVAQLSGGQSRALMIADCALLSDAPIILIDEIENAGIQKRQAVELLAGHDKIVLMTTHDPLLALMAQKRLVIANGGISKILERSQAEQKLMKDVESVDQRLLMLREKLRLGERLEHFSLR